MAIGKTNYIESFEGKFIKNKYTSADLKALFDAFNQSRKDTLMLHFHGGLVPRDEALKAADNLLSKYNISSYPVFFVWHTGIFDVLKDRIKHIEDDLTKIIKKAEEFLLEKFRHASLLELKLIEEHPDTLIQIERELTQAELDEFKENVEVAFSAKDTAQDEAFTPIFWVTESIGLIAKIVKRYLSHTDHGLRATITEEVYRVMGIAQIGKNVWFDMKRFAEEACQDNPEAVGNAVILGLKERTIEPKRIVLVGHSAGSIFVLEFLKRAAVMIPDVKFDLIFLAPACTIQLFRETYENAVVKNMISNIRIFGMHDGLERADELVKHISLLYPSSLLYLVSGCFEDETDKPLLGMERYYSGKKPYESLFNGNIAFVKNNVFWSISNAGDGKNTTANSHGGDNGLDLNNETVESVKYILSKGYGQNGFLNKLRRFMSFR